MTKMVFQVQELRKWQPDSVKQPKTQRADAMKVTVT